MVLSSVGIIVGTVSVKSREIADAFPNQIVIGRDFALLPQIEGKLIKLYRLVEFIQLQVNGSSGFGEFVAVVTFTFGFGALRDYPQSPRQ